MLKRIKYISRYSQALTHAEVEEIGRKAARRNEELGVTGVLMAGGGLFFQILEGPAAAVDKLWGAIASDGRHEDVVLLAAEDNVAGRIFPDWAMRRIDLDHDATAHMETLRSVLAVAFAQRRQSDELIGVLERAVWSELATRAL
jgi:hypothetical protein